VPFLLLTRTDLMPIAVGIFTFQGLESSTSTQLLAAACLISVAPAIVVLLVLQRMILSAMTTQRSTPRACRQSVTTGKDGGAMSCPDWGCSTGRNSFDRRASRGTTTSSRWNTKTRNSVGREAISTSARTVRHKLFVISSELLRRCRNERRPKLLRAYCQG
jgi:hypothetical protein